MTEEELLAIIIIKIEKLGISVRENYEISNTAFICPEQSWCVYNPDYITVFDITHEYIHALCGDNIRECDCDTISPAEKRANK